jgi:hypothetical protein
MTEVKCSKGLQKVIPINQVVSHTLNAYSEKLNHVYVKKQTVLICKLNFHVDFMETVRYIKEPSGDKLF